MDQLKLEEEEYIVSDIDPESIAFHDCCEVTNGSATGSITNEDVEESITSSIKIDERLGMALKRDGISLGGKKEEEGEEEEDHHHHHHHLEAKDEGDNERKKTKEDFIKFGESIAAQLAQVPDSYSRSVAKLRINQILFEAEIGVYAQTRS